LVLLFTGALLALLVPPLARRCRWPALAVLLLVTVLHTAELRADALLLVHQGGGDLLVARHQGRAALVASRADPFLCEQARRLAQGLGVERFDWLLLLDPVAPQNPACWQERAGLSLLSGGDAPPLAAGQRIASAGLEVQSLSMDSQALLLRLGRQRWLLLPDRQAVRSLEPLLTGLGPAGWSEPAFRRQLPPFPESPALRAAAGLGEKPFGIWLGFVPGRTERRILQVLRTGLVWVSGPGLKAAAPLPTGWRATGASGYLAWAGG
jgi:competence protein ComEC